MYDSPKFEIPKLTDCTQECLASQISSPTNSWVSLDTKRSLKNPLMSLEKACLNKHLSASSVRLLRNKKRRHSLKDEFGWSFPSSYDSRHCVPLKLTATRINVDPQIIPTTKECWMPRFHLIHFTREEKTLLHHSHGRGK
jgi:hypothetical protein